jgi:hypothetical protein
MMKRFSLYEAFTADILVGYSYFTSDRCGIDMNRGEEPVTMGKGLRFSADALFTAAQPRGVVHSPGRKVILSPVRTADIHHTTDGSSPTKENVGRRTFTSLGCRTWFEVP